MGSILHFAKIWIAIHKLEDEETRKIAPIAISLTGNRSVVVIKTPRGAIKERKIPVAN